LRSNLIPVIDIPAYLYLDDNNVYPNYTLFDSTATFSSSTEDINLGTLW